MDALKSLCESITTLPSLPAIAMKIVREVKKDKFALRDLTDIISYDPALSAKILRVANSAYYSLPEKVDSIDRAVNVLGMEALKNIALSFVIVKGLKRRSVDIFDHELFWKRSVTAAVSAEMLASRLNMKHNDTFVVPLLMDIGILVMYLSKPADYLKVLDLKRASNIITVEVERSIFGFDHQEVGSEILKAWNIPENIRMPIAYHHRKNGCPSEYSDMVDVLMISDMLSSFYHDSRSIEKIAALKQTLGSALKMNEADAEAFIDEVAERTLEILSSFEIDKGDMKPYSQILQEANEELGKLNLSYEQLVIELKDAKRDAENYAVELWDVKEKMREIAVKDSLTGLFNHRYFQELLEREIYRAERYARPLSLLMIDIDHFKKVNDTYGHPKGDMVLQEIGELLRKSIRGSDTAARYGGEEFAIVLPETEMNGAMALAERVRKTVEKLEVKIYEHTITVTISIGLTTYNPATAKKSKAEIIEAADRALYNSKEAGRNRLSVS